MSNYNFISGGAVSDVDISEFMQIIWKQTSKIGAGFVTAPSPRNPLQNVTYIVVMYDVSPPTGAGSADTLQNISPVKGYFFISFIIQKFSIMFYLL